MIQEISVALYQARTPYFSKEHRGSGFYAMYLKANHTLSEIEIAENRLLYVGKTEAGFSYRDHFNPGNGHSGNCSLRRTLGALLKKELSLQAQSRSKRRTKNRFTNYRFTPEGEARLSDWMKGALYVSRVPFEQNVVAAEAMLISGLEPPLNITGWRNPQAERLMALRRTCAAEARASDSLWQAK